MKACSPAAFRLLALMCTSLMLSASAQGPQSEQSMSGEISGSGGVLPNYAQCGGKSGTCGQAGNGPCQDAIWSTTSCPAGFSCNRQNEWYYQCLPAEESSASAAEQSGGAVEQSNNGVLPNYAQCGGLSGMCGQPGMGPCQDAIWTSPVCPSGYSCQKQTQWYYQCLPQGQNLSTPPSEQSSAEQSTTTPSLEQSSTANASPAEQSSTESGTTDSSSATNTGSSGPRKLMA